MGKRQLILVIDDEKDLTEMIAFQFRARGYDTMTASNGLEGLEKIREASPDLIVLDMNMPKMGGLEFYQNICGSDGRPAYPVLVLTARANMEQLFKDLDVDGFIPKPFEIDELIHEAEVIITKKSRVTERTESTKKRILRSVYVIDDEAATREPLVLALLAAGYRVASAASGTAGLELLAMEPPQLALVKLALPDIAGDVIVQKAMTLAKTSGILLLLYEKRDIRHHKSVRKNIGEKTGVVRLLEYDAPEELVAAVDAVIREDEMVAEDDKG